MIELDISIDLQSPVALHEQIVRELRQRLAQGDIPQGARLPPVRQMAEALQVHFNTVAHAYRQLEMEGWLSTRPGRGTYVWRAKYLQLETPTPNLDGLTGAYLKSCHEGGYSEMDILRELRKQMLTGAGNNPAPES